MLTLKDLLSGSITSYCQCSEAVVVHDMLPASQTTDYACRECQGVKAINTEMAGDLIREKLEELRGDAD